MISGRERITLETHADPPIASIKSEITQPATMKRCDDTRQLEVRLTSGQPITAARCNRSISGALRLVTGYCRDESIPSVRPESVDHPVPPALPRPRITAAVMTLAMSDELEKTPIVGVTGLVTISGLEIHTFISNLNILTLQIDLKRVSPLL